MAQKSLPLSGAVGAANTLTLTLKNDTVYSFLVGQIGIEMPNAGSSATCVVRKNGNMVTPAVAQADAPSGEPFVPVHPGERITVEWASATVGAIGTATFYYDDGVPAR